MSLATGAVIAGTTAAAAAYLNAKYQISKDLEGIRQQKAVVKFAQDRAKSNKSSLWYVFEEQASQLQSERAIWYRRSPSEPTHTLSWQELYEQSTRWAQFLLKNGVQPGELVATYLQNSPEFLINLMGLWAIGCAPAMINFHLSGDGLVHCLKVAGSRLLLVDDDATCRERVEEVRGRVENELNMRIITLDVATRAAIAALEPIRPDNSFRDGVTGVSPLFLFYTSGTTGFPKACAFQTQKAYGICFGRESTLGIKGGPNGDTMYDCMPLYHGTGCVTALHSLLTGVAVAIGRRFSVHNFWQDVHDSEASAFVYVGETARYLLAAPPSPLDRSHKIKGIYGNGLRPDVWIPFQERFNIPCIHEFFNSTEAMFLLNNVCRGPFRTGSVGHHGLLMRWHFHDIYIPVAIDHENGDSIWRDPKTGFAKRKSYDEGGEIIVRCQSENDFSGYWRNAEATAKRFERDVFRKGDLFYRTGDALRRDSDGRWYFLDRLGDTFRWKSENVSTAEVAEVLGRFPGIVEANVYGVALPRHDGRAGCAAIYIRPQEQENFDFAGLLAHARKRLPKYAVPVFLRMTKNPTLTHNNKQNKVPLRKEGVDPEQLAKGAAGPDDVLFWTSPGADKYVPFTNTEWQEVIIGKAKL